MLKKLLHEKEFYYTDEEINIIKDGPAERRKFLDIMISQLRPNYMHILNLYLKLIHQI